MGAVEPLLGVMGDDAACFLTTVLQGMKPKGDETGGVGHADRSEYATFFVKAVRIERMGQKWLHHGILNGFGLSGAM